MMKNITFATFTVLFIFITYFNGALSTDTDSYTVEAKKKDVGKKYSPLWFGPRFGRRKRNPAEDMLKNLDRDELETLIEAVRNNPEPVDYSTGERRTIDFTPRLGRESGETMEDADFEYLLSHRSSPFAPRLGRRLSPYSPRLGREQDVLLQ